MTATRLAEAVQRPSHLRRYRLPKLTPLTTAAVLGFSFVAIISALADVIAPHNPLTIYTNVPLHPPSAQFWWGTDNFGRDVFSRVLYGTRTSVLIAVSSVALGAGIGIIIGLVSGYIGGYVDFVIQRCVEISMALPTLVAVVIVVAVFGPSKWNVALAIAIVIAPTNVRVMRAVTLKVSRFTFCEAARAIGASSYRVMFRHVLPNCIGSALVVATANFGGAILAEASLGFLGLGVPPPEPSLGGMLSGAAQLYFYQAPWMAVFPGLVISFLVFCANILGDALRDYLDPRLRSRL